MTVIAVVTAIVFPALRGFFHGRNLDNEARQFLSLTRYGQSRAIAEGTPVELWINPRLETYGLQSLSGYTQARTNPLVYSVDQTVQIFCSAPTSMLTRSNVWTQPHGQAGELTKIRFQPDGFVSDTSPANIYFRQLDTGEELWIVENPTHMRYELQPGHSQIVRR
jgi:Tfp pilus assembly protein FimT